MNLKDLKPGQMVEIESPADLEAKQATLKAGFTPHRNIGRYVGAGIHRPVNADVGHSGMVTIDMGGGCHVYCHPSWLKPVDPEDPRR